MGGTKGIGRQLPLRNCKTPIGESNSISKKPQKQVPNKLQLVIVHGLALPGSDIRI